MAYRQLTDKLSYTMMLRRKTKVKAPADKRLNNVLLKEYIQKETKTVTKVTVMYNIKLSCFINKHFLWIVSICYKHFWFYMIYILKTWTQVDCSILFKILYINSNSHTVCYFLLLIISVINSTLWELYGY